MYGIAVSTTACLRGGTRVDVAWSLDPTLHPDFDPADALAITPGGGRLGSLLGGAFDGQLVDRAGVQHSRGRVIELEVGPVEASVSALEAGQHLRFLLTPATELPEELWPALIDRQAVCLVSLLDGDEVTSTEVYTETTIHAAPDEAQKVFGRGGATFDATAGHVITVLRPRPTLVVFGAGDIPQAMIELAAHLGWATMPTNSAGDAAALAATLSAIDGVVVFGHDAEMTGRVLEAALSGGVGYIGSVGPGAIREAREDWLAYRGVTDTSRVRSPAGLAIGARNPKEIALAVVGEMVAVQTGELS